MSHCSIAQTVGPPAFGVLILSGIAPGATLRAVSAFLLHILAPIASPFHNTALYGCRQLPRIEDNTTVGQHVAAALVVTIVGVSESVSVAKKLAAKRGATVKVSQEMLALGLANFVGSFFKAYPVTGSLSRTAGVGLWHAPGVLHRTRCPIPLRGRGTADGWLQCTACVSCDGSQHRRHEVPATQSLPRPQPWGCRRATSHIAVCGDHGGSEALGLPLRGDATCQ